mmetsp:Transcript_126144/g.222017  ORF Transcript_126144/g.222017 Transcript_126144/m.222017 type:complete len:110 (-) Transcript_126144:945-1274(-)
MLELDRVKSTAKIDFKIRPPRTKSKNVKVRCTPTFSKMIWPFASLVSNICCLSKGLPLFLFDVKLQRVESLCSLSFLTFVELDLDDDVYKVSVNGVDLLKHVFRSSKVV